LPTSTLFLNVSRHNMTHCRPDVLTYKRTVYEDLALRFSAEVGYESSL
jgi:hypothetical protein